MRKILLAVLALLLLISPVFAQEPDLTFGAENLEQALDDETREALSGASPTSAGDFGKELWHIVSNAAGGVNEGYRPGDIMVISDHIKLNGASPMRGKNLPEFGDRFFDVSRMYTPRLRELALKLAKDTALRIHEGVYFFMPGPQFETPAEIRAIRLLGGDAVGMSTVTEALTAAHCGMELLGFSVITNMGAGMLDQPLTTEEVSETGRMIEEQFSAYLKSVIREMNGNE